MPPADCEPVIDVDSSTRTVAHHLLSLQMALVPALLSDYHASVSDKKTKESLWGLQVRHIMGILGDFSETNVEIAGNGTARAT